MLSNTFVLLLLPIEWKRSIVTQEAENQNDRKDKIQTFSMQIVQDFIEESWRKLKQQPNYR